MRAGVVQGGLISSVLFYVNVNDMPVPSHHVELAFYADYTVVMATSRKAELIFSCLKAYLANLERLLTKWRITINISKRRQFSSLGCVSRILVQFYCLGNQSYELM